MTITISYIAFWLGLILALAFVVKILILLFKPRKNRINDNAEELIELEERCKRLNARIEILETIIIENERNSKSTTHDKS